MNKMQAFKLMFQKGWSFYPPNVKKPVKWDGRWFTYTDGSYFHPAAHQEEGWKIHVRK